MPYKILPTVEFSKDFSKVEKPSQLRIKNKIQELAQDPTRYKHLAYDLKSSCRIRIGKLRVIFSYDIEKKELYLEKIVFGHRY
tara:strand:+ start:1389 stop:1637 length:249 start_codon:yes stop_codon:yes gene_type:complete